MVKVGENSLLNKIVSNRHVLSCMYMQGTALNHSDNAFQISTVYIFYTIYI